jgi:hypothetical protein
MILSKNNEFVNAIACTKGAIANELQSINTMAALGISDGQRIKDS